jgi:hypothetical protein
MPSLFIFYHCVSSPSLNYQRLWRSFASRQAVGRKAQRQPQLHAALFLFLPLLPPAHGRSDWTTVTLVRVFNASVLSLSIWKKTRMIFADEKTVTRTAPIQMKPSLYLGDALLWNQTGPSLQWTSPRRGVGQIHPLLLKIVSSSGY